MSFIENIIEKAKKDKTVIVLPESTDVRILKASQMAMDAGTADIILVGNESEIKSISKNNDIDISKAKIIDPQNVNIDKYVEKRLYINDSK